MIHWHYIVRSHFFICPAWNTSGREPATDFLTRKSLAPPSATFRLPGGFRHLRVRYLGFRLVSAVFLNRRIANVPSFYSLGQERTTFASSERVGSCSGDATGSPRVPL